MGKTTIEWGPGQELFYNADNIQERAIWGGWASGKSFCALHTMLKYLVSVPGSVWWACRKNMPEVDASIWVDFQNDVCPSDWITRKNEQKHIINVRSSYCTHEDSTPCPKCSTLIFKGLDDLGKIENANLSGVFIDQAEETEEEMITKLQGRLRRFYCPKCFGKVMWVEDTDWFVCPNCGKIHKDSVTKTYMLIAGNPHPGWAKNRYYLGRDSVKKLDEYSETWNKCFPAKRAQDKDTNVLVVNLQSMANRRHQSPGYIAGRLATTTDEFAKRFIYASWDHFAGAALKHLVPETHFIDSTVEGLPRLDYRICDKWCAYDWGHTNPFAFIVFAKDRDGVIYAVDELYGSEVNLEDQIIAIRDKIKLYFTEEEVVTVLADPSIWNKVVDGKTRADLIDDCLFRLDMHEKVYFEPATNEEEAGTEIINSRFKQNTLYIFRDKCLNSVIELPGIRYQEHGMQSYGKKNKPEKLVDRKNHTFDCFKYGLNSSIADDMIEVKEHRQSKIEKFEHGELDWSDEDYAKIEDHIQNIRECVTPEDVGIDPVTWRKINGI